MKFTDRAAAGCKLGIRLAEYADRPDILVLGLPRGGVPVAFEVAKALKAPLDIFLVRKLGVPRQPELAMGAIAGGGVQILNDDLIREMGLPTPVLEQVVARERLELDRREHVYRGARRAIPVRDRTVILVDDGLATGATMEVAVKALRRQGPAAVVVAVPVGAPETCERLRRVADSVVCLESPDPFIAVGRWYREFEQTDDEEVIRRLGRAWAGTPSVPEGDRADDRKNGAAGTRATGAKHTGADSDLAPVAATAERSVSTKVLGRPGERWPANDG